MIFQAVLNASRPVSRVRPVQLRQEHESERQPKAVAKALAHSVSSQAGSQAAVLHFGSQALGLARGEVESTAAHDGEDAIEAGAAIFTNDEEAAADTREVDATGRQRHDHQDSPLADDPFADDPLADEPSAEEQRQIAEMKRRDREVRTHEQAHKSAGGSHTGAIQLQYALGPDGKRYAVGGSVPIDVSAVGGDPQATLRKMDTVRRAATSPANPSGADRRAAAQAARTAQRARAQIAAERYAKTQDMLDRAQGPKLDDPKLDDPKLDDPKLDDPKLDDNGQRFAPGGGAPDTPKASRSESLAPQIAIGRSLSTHVLKRERAGIGNYFAPIPAGERFGVHA